MLRLVAVARQQHDFTGPNQCLEHDLVGRRRAAGDKERPPGPKGPRGEALRVAKRAVGLEQRVEAPCRRRSLGKEDVAAVERLHVLDPVRLRDRLAARDGHRVKDARRLAAVLAQGVEERRVEAVLDALENAQVQLPVVLLAVENAAELATEGAGDVLHGGVGDQKDVQLRPQLLDHPSQQDAALVVEHAFDVILVLDDRQVLAQDLEAVGRVQREAVADDATLDVVVEENRDERVLEAPNDDEVVHEVVLVSLHLQQALADLPLLAGREVVDHENFEVWLGFGMDCPAHHVIEVGAGLGGVKSVAAGRPKVAAPVRVADEQAHDAAHVPGQGFVFATLEESQ